MAIWRITVLQRHTSPYVEIRNTWDCGDLELGAVGANVVWSVLHFWYLDYFSKLLPPTWTLYGATIQNMSVAGMPIIPATALSDIDGVIGYTVGITQAAAILNMRAATARPNRARKFIGPLAEQSVLDSQLGATQRDFLSDWVNEFNTYQADHTDDGLGFVSARYDPAEGRVTSANLLTSASYSVTPGALRSRKAGVGI